MRRIVCLIILLLPLLTLTASAQAAVSLADGSGVLPIMLPANASDDLKLAATELQTFIGRLSGKTPRILSDSNSYNGPLIALGFTRHTPASISAQVPAAPAGEGFVLKALDGRLYILGGSDLGTLWGVYELLEYFGVRFFLPGEAGTVVPQRATLELPSGFGRTDKPDFMHRRVWYAPQAGLTDEENAELKVWHRRNRMGGVRGYVGHAWYEIVPPAEFNTHPELFAFYQGQRQPLQLCISNPEVVRRAIAYIDSQFKADPKLLFASLSPNDGHGFCQSPETLKMAEDLSGQILVFVNQVARAIRPRHPERQIAFYAYAYNVEPPVDPQLIAESNVNVWVAHHGFDQINPIATATEPGQSRFRAIVEDWSTRTQHLGIQEYAAWWPVLEVNYQTLRDNRRFYYEQGARVLDSEYLVRAFGSDLYMYLELKLLWDVDADVDALLKDYAAAYGKQAETVLGVYAQLENMVRSRGRDTATTGELSEMLRLVDNATLATAVNRLQLARMDVDPPGMEWLRRLHAQLAFSQQVLRYYQDDVSHRQNPTPANRSTLQHTARALIDQSLMLEGQQLIGTGPRREAETLLARLAQPATAFTAAGEFNYLDTLDLGGNAVIDARAVANLAVGSYGLEIAPGQDGSIVYEFSAPAGKTFDKAELYGLFILPQAPQGAHNRIEFSTDGGQTFRAWVTDQSFRSHEEAHDISHYVRGMPRFQVRFWFRNDGKTQVLGLDNWGVRGVIR